MIVGDAPSACKVTLYFPESHDSTVPNAMDSMASPDRGPPLQPQQPELRNMNMPIRLTGAWIEVIKTRLAAVSHVSQLEAGFSLSWGPFLVR